MLFREWLVVALVVGFVFMLLFASFLSLKQGDFSLRSAVEQTFAGQL